MHFCQVIQQAPSCCLVTEQESVESESVESYFIEQSQHLHQVNLSLPLRKFLPAGLLARTASLFKSRSNLWNIFIKKVQNVTAVLSNTIKILILLQALKIRCQIFQMKLFAKIINGAQVVNCFCEKLHRRYLKMVSNTPL